MLCSQSTIWNRRGLGCAWGCFSGDLSVVAKVGVRPEDTKRMGDAYELALVSLKLTNRSDPLMETVAHHIVEIAQTGEKNPSRICALAVERIRENS